MTTINLDFAIGDTVYYIDILEEKVQFFTEMFCQVDKLLYLCTRK